MRERKMEKKRSETEPENKKEGGKSAGDLEEERKIGCSQSALFYHSSFFIIELSNQCGA